MVFRFRIPVLYRYTVLVIYTFLGLVIFERPLQILGMAIVVYTLYALIGLWIFLSWNKTVALDTKNRVVEIGKRKLSVNEIDGIDLGFFKMSLKISLKDGRTLVFPYPIEDSGEFIRIFEEIKYAREVIG